MPDDHVVFVHGWATDSHVWEGVAKGFAGRSTLVDLPGHGNMGSWDETTLAPAVKEISRRVQGLTGRVIGVGWSLGAEALIAAQPGLKHRLKGLVLVGSTPCFAAKEDFPWAQPRALVKKMITDMKKDPAQAVERFYPLNFTREEAGTDEAKAFIRRYRPPGPASRDSGTPGCSPSFKYDGLTRALEALYLTDLREAIELIEAPVLLVHGGMDAVCPAGAAEFMGQRIRGARTEVFEGAGHAPFITMRERFMRVLDGFMEGLG